MARLDPRPTEELDHLQAQFEQTQQMMGYVPNSLPTMARVPGLVEAFGGLGRAVMANPAVPGPLAQMVAQVASTAAGCRYCQAHTTAHAAHMGVSEEKLDELWTWKTSDHFDAGERAALDLAFDAASVPNAVTDGHFATLRVHFNDDQIAGIVAIISYFGFLNRWNDTMATDLEAAPAELASRVLQGQGWNPGHLHVEEPVDGD